VQQIINVLTNAPTRSASQLNSTADALPFLSSGNKDKDKLEVLETHIDQIQDQALRKKIKDRLR
jgi:hypothetical protein